MKYIEATNTIAIDDIVDQTKKTLFLAGGITGCPDWQKDVVHALEDTDLILFNPRRADFPMGDPNAGHIQVKWEAKHLDLADGILFWFPCETICPIVLFELGRWSHVDYEKPIFVGVHPDYSRRFDVETQLKLSSPDVEIVYSLDELVEQVKSYRW